MRSLPELSQSSFLRRSTLLGSLKRPAAMEGSVTTGTGAGDETEAAGAARTTIAAAMATIMDSLESIIG